MPAYESAVLADGPYVYMKCQETTGTTLADSSGNSLPGSVAGTVSLADSTDPAPPTDLGNKIRLDGTSGHILFNSTNWFTPATNGFTLEGWFYFRSYTNWARFFDWANAASTDDLYWCFSNASTLQAKFRTTGSSYGAPNIPFIPQWHHLAITGSNAGDVRMYVDGALYGSATITAPNDTARQFKYVGRSQYSTDPYLSASVTHLAAYHKVLTQDQIAAHYRSVSSTADYYRNVRADNPWGFWPLGETASATTFLDVSPISGRSLSLTGTLTSYSLAGPKTGSNAIRFPNSTSTYLRCITSPSIQAFTYEAWIYLPTLPANVTSIISQGDATTGQSNNDRGLFVNTNGTVSFSIWNGSYTTITSPSALSTSAWHHVVAKWTPTGAMSLRINKSTVATGAISPLANGRGIYVHAGLNAAGGDVQISNLAYYYGALSDATTDAHYDQTLYIDFSTIYVTSVNPLDYNGGVSVYWDPVGFATSYSYRVDGGAIVSTGANNYVQISLTNGAHTFEVRPESGASLGGWTLVNVNPSTLGSYHQQVLLDNPIMYVPMDESSGPMRSWPRGYTWGLTGTTVRTNPPATRGSTYSTSGDGANSIATTSTTSPPPTPSGTSQTIECWVRMPPTGTFSQCCFAKTGTNAGVGFGVGISSPSTRTLGILIANIAWYNTSWSFPVTSGYENYHIMLTRTGTTFNVYVNGNLVNSQVTATPNAPNNAYRIGAADSISHHMVPSTIQIDAVSFYDTQLPQNRISQHFLHGALLYSPVNFSSFPLDSGLFLLADPVPGGSQYELTADNGATTVVPSYSRQILDDHPTNYYRLGDLTGTAATDSSGNARHATYSGSYSLNQTPAITNTSDNDRSFYTPVNGGATLAAASMPTITNLLSGEAWINPDSLTGYNNWFGRYNADQALGITNWSWGFYSNGANLELMLYSTAATAVYATTSDNPLQVGVWQHVAFSYDGNRMRVFLNGVEQVNQAATPVLATAALADFKIGLNNATARNFKGYIDEVAVYDYPLGPEQIQAHYNAGLGYFSYRSRIPALTNGTPYTYKTRVSNAVTTPTAWSTAATAAPSSTVYTSLVDRFNRSYQMAHAGHPDYGYDHYTAVNATIGISGDRAAFSPTGNGTGVGALMTAPVAATKEVDITFTSPAIVGNGSAGPIFRYLSSSNFWEVAHVISGGNPFIRLYNPAIGVVFNYLTASTTDVVRVITNEEYISVFRNGVQVVKVLDPYYSKVNPSYAPNRAGLRIFAQTTSRTDDLIIYSNSTADTTSNVNGKNAHVYKGRLTHVSDAQTYNP